MIIAHLSSRIACDRRTPIPIPFPHSKTLIQQWAFFHAHKGMNPLMCTFPPHCTDFPGNLDCAALPPHDALRHSGASLGMGLLFSSNPFYHPGLNVFFSICASYCLHAGFIPFPDYGILCIVKDRGLQLAYHIRCLSLTPASRAFRRGRKRAVPSGEPVCIE